eukprot:359913-Chlamydomonas_euryale.AAC.2
MHEHGEGKSAPSHTLAVSNPGTSGAHTCAVTAHQPGLSTRRRHGMLSAVDMRKMTCCADFLYDVELHEPCCCMDTL